VEPLSFYKLLSYGAIGLGCILAVLAYMLLRKEQDQTNPRKQVLSSIYVYMVFSLILTIVGFLAEYLHYNASQALDSKEQTITTLKEQLETRNKEDEKNAKALSAVEEKYRQAEQQLGTTRKVLQALMDRKKGKIQRLAELSPSDPSYIAMVREIQKDLQDLDKGIEKAYSE
jgi:hypothetical protein